MTARIVLLWSMVAALLTAMIGVPALRARAAGEAADATRTKLQQVSDHAKELVSLRAGLPLLPARDGQNAGLTPRVSETLALAGIPSSALTSLSPESEVAVGAGEGSRRRRATLTLAGVTLHQVGAFLDAWRQREPAWTVVAIDLAPQGGKPPVEGGDLPLRGVFILESIYTLTRGADR